MTLTLNKLKLDHLSACRKSQIHDDCFTGPWRVTESDISRAPASSVPEHRLRTHGT